MHHARQKSNLEVRALIRNERGEVLIVRNEAGPTGVWGFPGGKLRTGEPTEAGLQRLCRDQYDLDVALDGGGVECTYSIGFRTVRYRYLACALQDDAARPGGCAEDRWVLRPQLREYFFDAPTQYVVDEVLANLSI